MERIGYASFMHRRIYLFGGGNQRRFTASSCSSWWVFNVCCTGDASVVPYHGIKMAASLHIAYHSIPHFILFSSQDRKFLLLHSAYSSKVTFFTLEYNTMQSPVVFNLLAAPACIFYLSVLLIPHTTRYDTQTSLNVKRALQPSAFLILLLIPPLRTRTHNNGLALHFHCSF